MLLTLGVLAAAACAGENSPASVPAGSTGTTRPATTTGPDATTATTSPSSPTTPATPAPLTPLDVAGRAAVQAAVARRTWRM